MIERAGDLWSIESDWVCICTNGSVKKNGLAVMGRGTAAQATILYPELPTILGQLLRRNGNHVQQLRHIGLVGERLLWAVPTKDYWMGTANLQLIRRSCLELQDHWTRAHYPTVVLPRPGCGPRTGGLTWEQVRPIVAGILDDDRFIVVHTGAMDGSTEAAAAV